MLKQFVFLILASIPLCGLASENAARPVDRSSGILAGLLDAQLPAETVTPIELPETDTTIFVDDILFPVRFFGRPVYSGFNIHQTENADIIDLPEKESPLYWIQREKIRSANMGRISQNMMFTHPEIIIYNEKLLPEPPKAYIATVDPSTAKIEIKEKKLDIKDVKDAPKQLRIERRNWLSAFNGNVQFSQAFLSPNWYQGGNNNLNILASAVYNFKLNEAFHPNLLFENTLQYKLGLTSAPEDSLRNYSISEDLLQFNSKFGVKAWKRWFYSLTLQFKTQLFNNYVTNKRDLVASFLSPGELNLGIGMTYAYTNPKKTFNFNASIAPFSYNLKMCESNRIDPTSFGIDPGRHYASEYGSNIEAKMVWKMAYNISYTSRLFVFTNYEYLQGDWENTFQFDINKFLSTQLYVHVRYDSQTPYVEGSSWHKWQIKEILSFGFSYRFATPGT